MLGILYIPSRIGFEVQQKLVCRVGTNDVLEKLQVNWIVPKHGLFVAAFEIKGDEKWPLHVGFDLLAGAYAEHFGDFQEQTA